MKSLALLIFLALVGNECYAQNLVVIQPQTVMVPVVRYEPAVVMVPVTVQPVYQPVVVAPAGYWVRERCWPFCFERWRYVSYTY